MEEKRIYNILVVEDEEDANFLFTTLVSTNPQYKAFGAPDGVQALDILQKEKIDLVLLDIVMPKMDGIEVLKEIKENPEKFGKPIIIMLTNLNGDSAVNKTEELRADEYVLKIEIEPEDLLKKIDGYLINKKPTISLEKAKSPTSLNIQPVPAKEVPVKE